MLSKFLKDVKYPLKDITIVSPDYGGVKRARMVASKMSVPIAIVDKRRPKPNEVEIENILGDVKNKHCILPDDMIDTGGTMLSVAKLLKSKGAKSVSIIATHGLFNGKSIENFDQAFKDKIINHLYISNSIENNQKPKNATIVDISPLISSAISVFNTGTGSISAIYGKYRNFKSK